MTHKSTVGHPGALILIVLSPHLHPHPTGILMVTGARSVLSLATLEVTCHREHNVVNAQRKCPGKGKCCD